MADRAVKVRLSAQVQEYVDGMEKAARATRDTGSEAEKLAQKREAFERLGRASMVAGGAVVAGLTMATKAAIDWDSAWAGVTKTVDGSPEQLALVEQGLRDLTGVLPASHSEIAAVAEAAGQLGIQTPNVVAFTKTMIDLGETTNLTSEQAATSLARFTNIMGTSQGQVSNLGSALVELGNNYATTEAEILEMSMRLAGAGKQIGMTEGDVLGLATALSSVGIEAEAGGSAMSKVMIDIASSVEQGGDRLEQFAQVAGVSADDFAARWRDNAGGALALFVKGLANAESQGSSTLGVLADLGITEVRMRDALLRSASAADQFSEAMEQGNAAFKENTALTNEAEKRYETTAAKLSIMGNKVTDAAISIGQQFLPAVEGGAKAVGNFADALSGLDGPMGSVVAWGGLIVGTGLLGAGLWMAAIPKIAEYKVALETLELTGSRLVRTMSAVAKVGGAVAAWSALIAIAGSTKAEVTDLNNALERNADAQELVQEAAQANAERGWGAVTAQFQDVTLSSEEVTNALQNQRKEWSGFWDYMGDAAHQAKIKEDQQALALLGDEMAKLAGTDLSQLQSGLAGLADEFGLSRDDMWTFIEGSDDLQAALVMQAGALGLTTDKADLLKIAYGEVGPAAEESGDAASDAASDYMDQANAARAAADELYKLIDALMESNNVAQTAESANARYQQTLADVAEYVANAQAGLEGYSTSIDANTVEGSKNREMLAGLAADSQASAQATMEQEVATLGAEQAAINYRQRLAEGREALINQITALTGNYDAAVALADAIYKIPTQHETDILVDTAQATAAVNNWMAGLPQSFTVTGNVQWGQSAVNASALLNHANGGFHAYANGGIQEFAGGGFPTGIYSGGPPIHKFAEPETGWEAYISGKPDQRDRNRRIWVETGERLGMNLGGANGPVQVSLDGMRVVLQVGDQEIRGMIRGEIGDALAPVSPGNVMSTLGVR